MVKKIHPSGIKGEQGIAHIRKVVAAMEYLFYETGGVEAGIDGSIEIRDPETGEVANQIVQFQSKATGNRLPVSPRWASTGPATSATSSTGRSAPRRWC